MSNNVKITGKYLNEKWGVGAKHALYHKDSSWYHVLERFPGALFDPRGYILFTTKTEYRECKYLKIGKHLSVPEGIYSIPGYVLIEKDTDEISQILKVRESNPVWIIKERKKPPLRKEKTTPETYRDVSDMGTPDPTRVKSTTYRILRDTSLARNVKAIHDYECQICGLTIELQDGQRYAEAHHIKPLGTPHNGPDVAENIICVCPNHHAQLDYGAILLDSLAIKMHKNHRLGKEFIDYHNEVIYQQKF